MVDWRRGVVTSPLVRAGLGTLFSRVDGPQGTATLYQRENGVTIGASPRSCQDWSVDYFIPP